MKIGMTIGVILLWAQPLYYYFSGKKSTERGLIISILLSVLGFLMLTLSPVIHELEGRRLFFAILVLCCFVGYGVRLFLGIREDSKKSLADLEARAQGCVADERRKDNKK